MDENQLWDTTMDFETQNAWFRLRWKTVAAADDIFTTLMGDKVPPRRKFIEDTCNTMQLWIFREQGVNK